MLIYVLQFFLCLLAIWLQDQYVYIQHCLYLKNPLNFVWVQGATARNSVEWFVFTVFCFVTTFAIVPEVSITLVMQ